MTRADRLDAAVSALLLALDESGRVEASDSRVRELREAARSGTACECVCHRKAFCLDCRPGHIATRLAYLDDGQGHRTEVVDLEEVKGGRT